VFEGRFQRDFEEEEGPVRLPMFRRCHVSEEDLSTYLDDRLPSGARERVDAHLQECPDCASRLEEMRLLVAEIRRLPQTKALRSFAISPELAAVTRRDADRSRQREKTAARRVYLGFSGATVAAAVLLVAVLGIDLASVPGGSGQGEAPGTLSSRQAASPMASGAAEADQSLKGSGEGTENLAPEAATPPLPGAVTGQDRSSAGEASPAATPFGAAAATSKEAQEAQPAAEESSRLWLWILEGAAGGLIIGFGASAFWMRRRWVEVNRS
jgi:hypothetical protein